MSSNRRTFLVFAGTSAAMSLAGCTAVRNAAEDTVAPHDPIEASLTSKRLFGVRDERGYELFRARAYPESAVPLEETDGPVIPRGIDTDDAPTVPGAVVVHPTHREPAGTLDAAVSGDRDVPADLEDFTTPEAPLTADVADRERLADAFDEFVFDGKITVAERDDAATREMSMPMLAGDRTHYAFARKAFDTLRIGDQFRFRPSYSRPRYVSDVLEHWTAY
ncbi:hypothetical protein [Natrialba sp. INN-245]|uniref:hypothetical protein n=1 Tax=Natrialba sp. INN-245 TaxID=2690967 RepID=UPI001312FD9D|nr:hypothetical protein [Natrialba sp. INN-245]MWV40554.1 hypothetical protein [Natrialba sp. INN-245]